MSARLGSAAGGRTRRVLAVVAVALVVLGVLGVAVRLDAPGDGTVVPLGWSALRSDGVVVVVVDPAVTALRTGDRVTAIDGQDPTGRMLQYTVERDGTASTLAVTAQRPRIGPLVGKAWGNVVFVLALAGLAVALYLRRPEEPSTGPLLVLGTGLLGSTAVVVAGLPAVALATGGPVFWLFHLNAIGAYSVAWGGLLAFSLTSTGSHPWMSRRTVRTALVGPVTVMSACAGVLALAAPSPLRGLALLHSAQTAVAAVALTMSVAFGVVEYRRTQDPLSRSRLRWIGGGGAVAAMLGIVGWHLPQLVTGAQPLPWGALGLSGLPFVAGIAVALRRHLTSGRGPPDPSRS